MIGELPDVAELIAIAASSFMRRSIVPPFALRWVPRTAMSVSKVAIIGRPNVGKSSLFNWLSGRLISVVDPTAGVTRDRVEYLLHENDRYFELVDTGGLGIEDVDNLTEQIEYQILIAIEQADLLLFVVDAQTGVVPLDLEVAERLRRIDKPKLLVVNKCDSTRTDAEVHEFRRLCESPLDCHEREGQPEPRRADRPPSSRISRRSRNSKSPRGASCRPTRNSSWRSWAVAMSVKARSSTHWPRANE